MWWVDRIQVQFAYAMNVYTKTFFPMHGSKGDCYGPFITYHGSSAKINHNSSKEILFCKHLTHSCIHNWLGYFYTNIHETNKIIVIHALDH